ncbi:phage tail sheath subtilisin-like domain-containing protein [Nevskia ramosa]|uniref:phage tail sheath subtilisin-like domain-containing protein n=1 Tax=Nevskia ramosa TaxID=64002 RepID=UPI0023553E8E|nr:phage tail sheath subtilisin-like domain-containing protein [Nevskia ramosa]
MIQFNQIPVNFYVPGQYVEFDASQADGTTPTIPQRILLIGQMLAAGTGAANVATLVSSADEVAQLAGRGSMLHHMARKLFLVNSFTPVYLLAQADAGGATKAARQVTVGGSATANGELDLYVGDSRYAIGVVTGATAAVIAAAIAAAITADPDRYVDAAVDGGTPARVNFTARHGGIDAGRVEVTHSRFDGERLPLGVTLTIAVLVEGTVNPSIATGLAGLGESWYPTIALGYTDAANLTLLETELADRFGPLRQIEGYAHIARSADQATLQALVAARNAPHESVMDCADVLTPSWAVAASVAALDAGEPDPGRPRQTLTLSGVLARVATGRRSRAVRNQLLAAGVSTLLIDASGTVRIERLTTTYRLNANGLPDNSYFDTESLHLLANLRYTLRTRFANKYPRHKLGKDGSEGPNVMTPSTARAECIALYLDWLALGWVEGGVAFEQFKRQLRAEIDSNDPNRLNLLLPPDLINQLRTVAGQIQFRR